MAKNKKSPPMAERGKPGRLPVAPVKSPARLAGRGGEKAVVSIESFGKSWAAEFKSHADELVRINNEKAALELEAKVYRDAIAELMAEKKADESWTVRSENTDWIATYIVSKPGKKLVPELLIQAGVTDKQLQKGYKEIPAKKPYVQVRTKGDNTDINEEHE